MLQVRPQYINNTNGDKAFVVLPIEDFEMLLEMLDDVRLYDNAQKNDTGERIFIKDVFTK